MLSEDALKIFKNLPAFQEPPVLEEAVESYQKSIQAEPDNPFYYYQLGRAYHVKGKKLAALEAYQNSLRIKKSYHPARCGLASIYASIGKLKLAIREYSKILKSSPNMLEVVYNLAVCYEHAKMYGRAVSLWQNYIAKEPNPTWVSEARGHLQACRAKLGTKS